MEPFWLLLVGATVVVLVWEAAKLVPAGYVFLTERLGRHQAVLEPGVHLIIPVIDRVRTKLDMREQELTRSREPVVTRDNRVVLVDAVVFHQISDPRAAIYEIADYLEALTLLTVTTLRTVIGGMDVEEALMSPHVINAELRSVLSRTTQTWGVRVHRVEITAIERAGRDFMGGEPVTDHG